MSRGYQWCWLAVSLVGAALRCAELGSRPMHTDEAVDASKLGQLWRDGYYHYNPQEYHGPTLAYVSLAWQKLTLAPDYVLWPESRLRSLTVVFGLGVIFLAPLLGDGLGRKGALAAGLLTAVSPVMVYYSRDYIHETLFVFFTFLTLAAGWRYWRGRNLRWMLLAGAGAGLMQATKETCVFNFVAAAGALGLVKLLPTSKPSGAVVLPAKKIEWWHLLAGFTAWLAVAVLLFSSFFTNAKGPLDALRTYRFWLASASGATAHVHEWSFYFQRLLFYHVHGGPIWSEALILALAVVGGLVAFNRKGLSGANQPFLRFLVCYTAILTAIYTVLPYKTPWCALGFWHGTILLAGAGASALLGSVVRPLARMAAGAILLLGVGQLAFQARLAAVPYAADPKSPWCYAQTSPDLLNLVAKVNALAQVSPQGGGMGVSVIAPGDDYWPLPWYLRRYDASQWWPGLLDDLNAPVNPYAPVTIVSAALEGDVDRNKAGLMAGMFELRPGTFLQLYVQTNLWSDYLARRGK